METEINKVEGNKRKKLELILGIILLIPPLLSVFLFFIQFVDHDILKNFLETSWTGGAFSDSGSYRDAKLQWVYDYSGPVAYAYTSALPFYFGLMAIAGAFLIINSNKK